MDTLLLDLVNWDLTLDMSGNIAIATGPYAIAQDVASQGRLFSGELWYDTLQGMPYFQSILGQRPPAAFMRAKYVENGLLVPQTTAIAVRLDPIPVTRTLTGSLEITDDRGNVVVISMGTPWYISAIGP